MTSAGTEMSLHDPEEDEKEVTEGSQFLQEDKDSPPPTPEVVQISCPEEEVKGQATGSWTTSPGTGLVLAIASGLLFTSTGVVVKYLKGVHVLNLGLFRFLGMTLPATPLVIRSLIKRRGSSQGLFHPIWPPTDTARLRTLAFLFGRAFLGFASIICYFLAIQHMPVADVSVLGSLSIVSVAILAHFTLGERLGLVTFLAALLTLGGIICIAKPPLLTGQDSYDMDTLVGTGLSLIRMLLATGAVVLVRRLREVNGPLLVALIGVLQLAQNVVGLAVLGVFALPESGSSWALHLLVGGLSFASQLALTLALKCEEAGPFAIIRTSSDTLAAFLLQFLVFGVLPDYLSVLGAVIISGAVSLTVLRKWVSSRSGLHSDKGWMAWILK